MKIFADLHHGGLFHSLQLMAKRLDADIFRPVGMEWFHEGYFGLAEPYGNAIETVEQYLKIDNLSPVIHDAPAFNNYRSPEFVDNNDEIYEFEDYAHHCTNLGITLEGFKKSKFDVIIASIPQHLQKFWELRDKYQPQAKLIFQVGNPYWQLPPPFIYPNILDSCNLPIPVAYHKIVYHQEFETDIFYPDFNGSSKKIYSFVIFPQRLDVFHAVAKLLPDYEFVAFGHHADCDAPPITGIKNIADKMHEVCIGWHDKDLDGYGHVMFNWLACAKPLICGYQGYAGRLAERHFNEGVNTLNIDTRNPEQIAAWIRSLEDEVTYEDACYEQSNKFQQEVDFDKEGEELKKFFAELR